MKRQIRQASHRPGNVEEFGIGVDVGRQARVAMPHRGLGRPQGDASLRQVRDEGMPQGRDVDGAASLICLDDDLLAAARLDAGQLQEDVSCEVRLARTRECSAE